MQPERKIARAVITALVAMGVAPRIHATVTQFQENVAPDFSYMAPSTNYDLVGNAPGGTQGGGENVMRVGLSQIGNNPPSNIFRSVMVFDLTQDIPTGESVTDITLTLHLRGDEDSPKDATGHLGPFELYEVVPGGNLSGNQTIDQTQVDWSQRNGTNQWTTPGGDYNPNALSILPAFVPVNTGNFVGDSYTFQSTPAFAAAANESLADNEPLQLLLKSTYEESQLGVSGAHEAFARWLSNDSTVATSRPLLTVTSGVNSIWNADRNDVWSNSNNWTGGSPNGSGSFATFGSVITQERTITVDAPQEVGRMDFDNSHRYTLSGSGTITLGVDSGNAAVNVLSGSHTISAPLVLNNSTVFTVTPATSTLTVSGTFTSSTNLNITMAGAGTLELPSVQASTVNVSGGTLKMLTSQAVSNVSTLSLNGATGNWTSRLDLNNGAMLIDYFTDFETPSIFPTIVNQLKQGYANGAWNGNGIASAAAALAAGQAGAHKTGIGFADASTLGIGDDGGTLLGETVDDTTVALRYTYLGDSNLDGTVNSADFAMLAANYGKIGMSWVNGDYNMDGTVNALDFNALANNFGLTMPSLILPAPVAASPLGALVPEPSMCAGLFAGLAMWRRRSRLGR